MLGLRQAAKVGDGVHVALKVALHRGKLDLDDHLAAVVQAGPVRLPDGGGAERRRVKLGKDLLELLAQAALDNACGRGCGQSAVRTGPAAAAASLYTPRAPCAPRTADVIDGLGRDVALQRREALKVLLGHKVGTR